MMTAEREAAVRVLQTLSERALNVAEHADIEAWIESRSMDEGGFLWLAGALQMRPSVLQAVIGSVLLFQPKRAHRVLTKALR